MYFFAFCFGSLVCTSGFAYWDMHISLIFFERLVLEMKRRLALILLILFVIPLLTLLLLAILKIPNKIVLESNDEENFTVPQDSSTTSSTSSSTNLETGYILQYSPALYSDDELVSMAESLDFDTSPWPEGYDPFTRPIIDITSDDYIDIAKEYVRLYNTGEWSGVSVKYNGLDISVPWGQLEINGEDTGFRTNERIFYDIVKELYDRGVWDGNPTTLGSHTISINEKDRGYLLVDDYISARNMQCLDLPASFSYAGVFSTKYVSGEGIYVRYEDGTITRYVRGKVAENPIWIY